ncbi:MAG TPA: hypothetical protein DCR21_06395 [Succinivibrionaceae bacterium]|nr:hypothetical protein [Succinivibrionaceae bacterium]
MDNSPENRAELLRLAQKIEKEFLPENEDFEGYKYPNELYRLQDSTKYCFRLHRLDLNVIKSVQALFDSSFLNYELRQQNIIGMAVDDATIRLNWADALQRVTKGYKLSSAIGYGLTGEDIAALAALHKKNRYRKKIEDLLEDINYHTESEDFSQGRYEKYLISQKAEQAQELCDESEDDLPQGYRSLLSYQSRLRKALSA